MDPHHQLLSITNRGSAVLIAARGAFDTRAVQRLCDVLEDLIARGGLISDVVLDLRATSGCSTKALADVASLMNAGMRLAPMSDSCAEHSDGGVRPVRASVV